MLQSIDPWTSELIATYPTDPAEVVRAKIEKVDSAFIRWRSQPLSYRINCLTKLSEQLLAEKDAAAGLISREMGKPVREARAEVEKCALLCNVYAEHAALWLAPSFINTPAKQSGIQHHPLGVILAIMPWNFPLWQVFRFLVPTLTAGNTALLKHASNVTGSAVFVRNLLLKAGYPEAVFEVLFLAGEDVLPVLSHTAVRGVSLTGSEAAGAAAATKAASVLKPAVLELGGSDPFIVLEDADIALAAKSAVTGRFINGGQSCIAAKRFLVHEAVYDTFLDNFTRETARLIQGNPLDEQTDIGPMAKSGFTDEMETFVKDAVTAGARLCLGGTKNPLHEGSFLPTVLGDVTARMSVMQNECFGPVAPVMKLKNNEIILQTANQTRFGLGASVWTNREDMQAYFLENLQTGSVFFNEVVRSHPLLPFGGVKDSGYGRELGREGLLAFTNTKAFWMR